MHQPARSRRAAAGPSTSSPRTVGWTTALLLVLATLAAPLQPVLAQDASEQNGDSAPTANPDHSTYVLPPEPIGDMLRTDRNYATLDHPAPDGSRFLVPHQTELSTLELMSRTTYRLAGMEIRPETDRQWHLDTWGIDGFRFYSLADRAYMDAELPEGSFASDFTWSPDGSRVAFLAHLPSHTEVWTADAATGTTRSLSNARVLATAGTSSRGQGSRASSMLQWTPEGTVITLLVPADRGAEPARNPVPSGPTVRQSRDEPAQTRTYPFLLEDEHDENLFEHYTRAQIAELASGQEPRPLGEPGMYESLALSPDGQHILATRMERPFSYIVYSGSFPRTTVVLDRDGTEVAVLEERPLRETGGRGGNGLRDLQWRPDGAGLSYLAREPRDGDGSGDGADDPEPDSGGDDENGERPDRIMLLRAPFDTAAAEVVAESEDPIRGVTYSLDGAHAFASVSREGDGGLAWFDLTAPSPERRMVVDFHDGDDPTELPGDLLTRRTSNGIPWALVSSDGTAAYLEGDGYRDDFRPRPFVDRVALADGSTERLFEGSQDSFDRPRVPLDADLERMIVSRESKTDFPDSYLWSRDDGFGANLTQNRDPFPEVTAAERIDFEFTRRDGQKVQGRVSMPVGWEAGDDAVPAIFWTYPREYEQAEEYDRATVRSRNLNEFTHMSWLRWSDLWLTQGYALVYPDIPIIGENYNDTYIASLVDAMYAAIRAVDSLGVVDIDRIGHGGHSYGAFATANILANAPFFRAGIAGDGAYNRSLTPNGFQAERRTVWEAPHTYIEMSPFFRADQIETPLLMYHGADDDNSGTFPVQSRRMIHALIGLGKTAVLYEYPYESHTPRAIENKLDMWARFIGWFDEHVKGDGSGDATRVAEPEGGR